MSPGVGFTRRTARRREALARAGSLGPLIREPDGSVYPSARRVPKLVSGTSHALLGAVWKNNPFTRAYLDDERTDVERAAGWLSGSCLLSVARHSTPSADSTRATSMYMEDVDLGDRLGKAGWQNVFVPSAEILHTRGHAAGKNPELMLPAHHASAYRFQADHNLGTARTVALGPASRSGTAIPDRRACSAPGTRPWAQAERELGGES